jgi:oligopeptide transport system substrate-binding protein
LINSDLRLNGMLMTTSLSEGLTLEGSIPELQTALLTGLADIQFQPAYAGPTIAGGQPSWIAIASAALEDGTRIKIHTLHFEHGGLVVMLVSFGSATDIDAALAELDALGSAFSFENASINGIQRSQGLFLSGGESTNPREYDPATTHGSGDKLIFSGLVALNLQMQIIPDLAETWSVTDGVTYTFTLRANARFHNGRPLTAADVAYSWERAADPETDSDTVLTYLGDIVGVREKHAGQADTISGLKVIDEHTLQVTIDQPKPYFLLKLTYPTAFVLDRYNIESGEEWYRTPNGTGPYRLIRWDSFSLMLYERNPYYHLETPAIAYVVNQIYGGVGIRMYESNSIDVTGIGSNSIDRVLDPNDPLHAELISGVTLCTSYDTFDVTQPPFDDPKVRQAFVMAFDRQKYLDVVEPNISIPAKGLYPPGLPGYTMDLQGLPYDPEAARQLLAESKYGGPEGLPTVVFTTSGSGSDIGSDVAAKAQMWQQNLGVTIQVENLEPDKYFDLLAEGYHGQIFSGGWCADYPDPENFADVLFHTGAEMNSGSYSNPELDSLLEQARTETDVQRRIQLYQQAEQIIVNDAPALFVSHSLGFILVKPHIQNYVFTPIDIALERYLWIDTSKLK